MILNDILENDYAQQAKYDKKNDGFTIFRSICSVQWP